MPRAFGREEEIVFVGGEERSRLGRGGSGRVHLVCPRAEPARRFAMKVVEIDSAATRQFVEREVALHQSLLHPNVIRLHEVLWLPGRVCLFLDYAERGSLRGLLSRGDVGEAQLLALFEDVCCGVAYLHGRGTMHRDLKPENVLLGADGRARLCDFGLSTHTRGTGPRLSFCGTFEYMSPEVFAHQPQTSKSDVWALGVMLFELLTERPPFAGNTADEVWAQVRQGRLSVPRGLNRRAVSLVLAMLQLEPARRPTAEEVLSSELFQVKKDRSRERNNAALTSSVSPAPQPRQLRGGSALPSPFPPSATPPRYLGKVLLSPTRPASALPSRARRAAAA